MTTGSSKSARRFGSPGPGGLLFILSGPSGVGKDSLLQDLRTRELEGLHFAVTATTRQIRQGEEPGVHYHFMTKEHFTELVENGGLLEWARVHENLYGVPNSEVLDFLRQNEDVILKIDTQGARTVRAKHPDAIGIFLLPPSFEALDMRLAGRHTETVEELAVRRTNARQEMDCRNDYDYQVMNDDNDLDTAVDMVRAVILAERCRVRFGDKSSA